MKIRLAAILLTALFASLWTESSAQDQTVLDSLFVELSTAAADTSLVNINLEIGGEFLFNYPDTAVYYIDAAFELAEQIGDTLNVAECYNLYGIIGTIQGKYLTGIENFQSSLEWYHKGEDLEGAANIINNIGVIYGYLDNYKESIKHYKESHRISESLENHQGAALSLFNIAADFLELEQFDSLRFYTLRLEEFQALHDEEFISASSLWGEIYLHEEKLDSAEYHYEVAYKKNIEDQDLVQATASLTGLATVYKEQRRYVKSLRTLHEIDELASKHQFNESILSVMELRAEIAKNRGEYETAYEYQGDYLALKDSLDGINNLNRINELNAKYQTEKSEKELVEIQALMTQKEAKKTAQDRIFMIIGLFIVIVIAIMLISIRRKKKTNHVLNNQNVEINIQRQKILSSINYAKKIQNSILTPEHDIRRALPESFVYFKPKDIVSGDFYWFADKGDKIIISTIDCTGHGVPGAFMSLIANSKLNKVVNELKIEEPAEILNAVHEEIVASLNQASNIKSAQDGMDMSLCVIDKEKEVLKFAGAQNSIYIVDQGKVNEIKADCLSIGGTILSNHLDGAFQFSTKEVPFKEGNQLFMFTDGYMDQFGGVSNKKLNKSKFKKLIHSLSQESLTEAKSKFEDYLKNWMGPNAQVDDILIIGAQL